MSLSEQASDSMQSQAAETHAYPRFRWYVAATAIFANIAVGMFLIVFAPILGVVAPEFGITLGQATILLLTSFVFANAIGIIASGPLIDRFGIQACLICGGVLAAISCLWLPFSTGLPWIVAMRALQGLGLSPAAACVPALAARWFPPKERGLVVGGQGFGMALGMGASLIGMPTALQRFNGDWRRGMVWLAMVAVVSLIMCFILLFGKEPKILECVDPGSPDDFKLAIRQSSFYIGTVCLITYAWLITGFSTMASTYLAVDAPLGMGFGPMLAGKQMLCVEAGMVVGSLLAGIFAQQIFKGNLKPMIMLGFLLSGAFILGIKVPSLHGSMVAIACCLFLAGFFLMFVIVGVSTFVALHYPHDIVGKVFAIMFGISMFGGTLGVGIGGAILNKTNSFDWPFIVFGVIAIIGILAAALLKPPSFS
jgi:MFS family permease